VDLATPREILVLWRDRAAAKPADLASGATRALHRRYGLMAETPVFETGRPLVSAKPRSPGATSDTGPRLGRWVVLRFTSHDPPAGIARLYADLDEIEIAQPNFLRHPVGRTPNDPLFSEQWGLADMGWATVPVPGAAGVVVGVVDSGVDFRHPDIATQVWGNAVEWSGLPGVDDDENGYVDDLRGWDFTDAPTLPGAGDYLDRDADPLDESGHGTHVAGIIAAGIDNGIGTAGLAPDVRVMPLRAGFNVGSSGFLQDDDIAAAMVYAVDNGADVINLSFGDPRFSALLRDAARYARERGVVVVAAAGNEGTDQVLYPARFDETIAVAAAARDGRIAAFSNRGPSIDLAAPGQQIRSLLPAGQYGDLSGTSMAAAHVSGLAALILGRQPQLEPLQVLGALAQDSRDVLAPGWDAWSGWGLAQVAGPAPAHPLVVEISSPGSGTKLGDSTSVTAVVAGVGLVQYEISWGFGASPSTWMPLTGGSLELDGGQSRQLRATWRVADLPEGSYIVRAQVASGPIRHSDRTEVTVARRQPLISGVQVRRLLNGPEWEHVLEWRTDTPSGGAVQIESASGGGVLFSMSAPPGRHLHAVTLPSDLLPGTYRVEIAPDAGAGTPTATLIEIGRRGAGGWDLEESGRLPSGYVMPQIVDFDNDGWPEVVEMPFGIGAYNSVGFYEAVEGGVFSRAHTTSLLFVPWSAGDVDGDGRQEIMAVDAGRVRLLEAGSPGLFPDRVAWEQQDVWGGETGDLDADGHLEIYLRSSRSSLFRVYEARGDDDLAEVAVLPNPTAGLNEMGDRQVIGDLDDDGRGDLLGSDADGDVFVYESVAGDQLRAVWSESWSGGDGEACVVGGPADLDGDGAPEFAVARFRRDRFDLRDARWEVSVYGSSGDNAYELEWSIWVQGGKPGGNGLAVGDLDTDGVPELIVATVPDLYVLAGHGASDRRVLWHCQTSDPHRPLVGDVDVDGRTDLLVRSRDQVRAFSLAPTTAPLPAPTDLRVRPQGEHTMALEWDPVTGANTYTVYRGDLGSQALVGGLTETAHLDSSVTSATPYTYSVVAVDARGGEGFETTAASAETESRPRIVQASRLSVSQLAVHFSAPMGPSAADSYRYSLSPGVGAPSSAVLDRGARRAVLGYGTPLPDSGRFRLELTTLESARGTPLHDDDQGFTIILSPVPVMTRPLQARAVSPTLLSVSFSGAVSLESTEPAAFEVDGGAAHIESVTAGIPGELLLWLSEATPVMPLGRVHEVRIAGLRDEAGAPIEGRLVFGFAAAELGEVIAYPNPYDPGQGSLTIANLPVGSTVSIANVSGRVVQGLVEEDGDGGVEWDGRNANGQGVGSGIYYYRVQHEGRTRLGKLAVIRE